MKIIFKIAASSLQGNSPNVTTQTVTDGGVLFNPILGNMLRTFHTVPQVKMINIFRIQTRICQEILIKY